MGIKEVSGELVTIQIGERVFRVTTSFKAYEDLTVPVSPPQPKGSLTKSPTEVRPATEIERLRATRDQIESFLEGLESQGRTSEEVLSHLGLIDQHLREITPVR